MQDLLNRQFSLSTLVWSIAVIVFLVIAYALLRLLFNGKVRSTDGARGRQPRLDVVVAHDLDRQRQLVLVRRDNVEHLIMIGGPNDLLIESTIVRAAPDVRPRVAGSEDAPLAQPSSRIPAPPPAPVVAPLGAGLPAAPPLPPAIAEAPMAVSFEPPPVASAPTPPMGRATRPMPAIEAAIPAPLSRPLRAGGEPAAGWTEPAVDRAPPPDVPPPPAASKPALPPPKFEFPRFPGRSTAPLPPPVNVPSPATLVRPEPEPTLAPVVAPVIAPVSAPVITPELAPKLPAAPPLPPKFQPGLPNSIADWSKSGSDTANPSNTGKLSNTTKPSSADAIPPVQAPRPAVEPPQAVPAAPTMTGILSQAPPEPPRASVDSAGKSPSTAAVIDDPLAAMEEEMARLLGRSLDLSPPKG